MCVCVCSAQDVAKKSRWIASCNLRTKIFFLIELYSLKISWITKLYQEKFKREDLLIFKNISLHLKFNIQLAVAYENQKGIGVSGVKFNFNLSS